jgi:hypothetical protein
MTTILQCTSITVTRFAHSNVNLLNYHDASNPTMKRQWSLLLHYNIQARICELRRSGMRGYQNASNIEVVIMMLIEVLCTDPVFKPLARHCTNGFIHSTGYQVRWLRVILDGVPECHLSLTQQSATIFRALIAVIPNALHILVECSVHLCRNLVSS